MFGLNYEFLAILGSKWLYFTILSYHWLKLSKNWIYLAMFGYIFSDTTFMVASGAGDSTISPPLVITVSTAMTVIESVSVIASSPRIPN